MKNLFQRGLSMLAVGGLIAGTAMTAEATSIPGFAGQPQNPTQYNCFTNTNGAVTNTCAGTEQYCVPLSSTSNGHDVKLTVTAPSISQNLSCFAQAAYPSSQLASTSGAPKSPQVFGSAQTVDLGELTVPSGGGLWACCYMEQGSTIDSINY